MTVDLAGDLRVSPETVRSWLRRSLRQWPVDKHTPWVVDVVMAEQARYHFRHQRPVHPAGR